MFTDQVALRVVSKSKAHSIEPEAGLAVCEVESSGAPFEQDGRTPTLLFERHIFHRQLSKLAPGKLARAERAGLAIPHWDRSTQYRDERSSAQRLALIAKAREIDEEIANQSASWGIGQTMGFNAQGMGFATATKMLDFMVDGGIDAQIDCMFKEFEHDKLAPHLNAHEWATVARIYNGKGYAANQYDTKLAAAYAKWKRKLPTIVTTDGKPARAVPPEQTLSTQRIKEIQKRLRALGYAEVGEPDGGWGSRSVGAMSAFKEHEGVSPIDGHPDAHALEVLFDPKTISREPSFPRQTSTVDDLRGKGSRTVEHADHVTLWGKLKAIIGVGFLGGGVSEKAGLIDQLRGVSDQGTAVHEIADNLQGLFQWAMTPTGLAVLALLIGGGLFLVLVGSKIRFFRLEDHQSGVHAGPQAEVEEEG